jgi:hypothetical protein
MQPVEPVEQPVEPGDGLADAHDAVAQGGVLVENIGRRIVNRVGLEKEGCSSVA